MLAVGLPGMFAFDERMARLTEPLVQCRIGGELDEGFGQWRSLSGRNQRARTWTSCLRRNARTTSVTCVEPPLVPGRLILGATNKMRIVGDSTELVRWERRHPWVFQE